MRSIYLAPLMMASCVSILISFPCSAAAQSTSAVTITASSIDELVKSMRGIVDVVAKSDEGFRPILRAQLDLLSQAVGQLDGIDRKRPVGIHSVNGPGPGEISFVGVVPVTDADALAEALAENFGARISGGAKGTKELVIQKFGPPLFYRIDKGHGYLALSPDAIPEGSFVEPDEIFDESGAGSLVCFVRPNALPEPMIRDLFARTDLHGAGAAAKESLDSIDVAGLRIDFDEPSSRLTIEARLAPKSGTELARSLANGTDRPNRFASLRSDDSVATILLSRSAKEAAEGNTEMAAVEAMLGGIVDLENLALLLDVRRYSNVPDATMIVALALKNGHAAEAMFVPMAQQLVGPNGLKPSDKKVTGATLYEVRIPAPPGDPIRTDPVLVAFTSDALIAAFGHNSLETLRKSTTMAPATKTGPPVRVDVSWTKAFESFFLLRLPANERDRFNRIPVLNGNSRWTVSGGRCLETTLEIDLPDFVAFALMINRIGTAAETKFAPNANP